MVEVLIVYATSEGQTAKIAEMLARRIEGSGASVRIVDLDGEGASPDLAPDSAVIVAASVHAGKHQDSAVRFVRDHLDQLKARRSAFLSVSLYAASTEDGGREHAREQAQSFLDETGWSPDAVQTVAGAVRFSTFSRPWQWIMRGAQRFFGKELRRDGWPDLTADREFTDWPALRRFADDFCTEIEAPRGGPTPQEVSGTVKGSNEPA